MVVDHLHLHWPALFGSGILFWGCGRAVAITKGYVRDSGLHDDDDGFVVDTDDDV